MPLMSVMESAKQFVARCEDIKERNLHGIALSTRRFEPIPQEGEAFKMQSRHTDVSGEGSRFFNSINCISKSATTVACNGTRRSLIGICVKIIESIQGSRGIIPQGCWYLSWICHQVEREMLTDCQHLSWSQCGGALPSFLRHRRWHAPMEKWNPVPRNLLKGSSSALGQK